MNATQELALSAASPALVRLLTDCLQAKSRPDVDGFVDFFSREQTFYMDPTLGLALEGWEVGRDALKQLMPTWAEGARSYATKILGDQNGAVVFMVDSKEMFGAEIRTVSAVDFKDGKIARWVDYWNGLDWPRAHLEQVRLPFDRPSDLKERAVGEQAAPLMRRVATAWASALATKDASFAFALLSPDAELHDLGLHLHLVGPTAIHSFLRKALHLLPYGEGSVLRHVVGGDAGGGYEWTASRRRGFSEPGITALELDPNGLIGRVTSAWNAESASAEGLAEMHSLSFLSRD